MPSPARLRAVSSLASLVLLTGALPVLACVPGGAAAPGVHATDATAEPTRKAEGEGPRESGNGNSAQAPDDGSDGAGREAFRETTPGRDAPAPGRVMAPRPVEVPRDNGAFRVTLLDGRGQPLRRFEQGGRTYVLGSVGERYTIRVSNHSDRRVEAVLSIDGRDALDGGPADFVNKRGYLLPAHGDVLVEGFRTSLDEVATFRFSSVRNAYAARMGDSRDVGAIGVAFFPEREPVAVVRPRPLPVSPVNPWERRRAEAPSEESADGFDRPTASGRGGAASDLGASPAPSKAEAKADDMPPPPAARASGPSTSAQADARKRRSADEDRPGLGTEFGEARTSHVRETSFVRARSTAPDRVIVLRYNDQSGLTALGIFVNPPEDELRRRENAEPFRASRFAVAPPNWD